MLRKACIILVAIGCGPEEDLLSSQDTGSTKSAAMLEGVRVTYYTLVTEGSTSGQHSGDSSVICDAQGLGGRCLHREFLCSGWGVAMQGSGIANDGTIIRYVSGGGGWSSGYRQLNNCASARFTTANAVTGTSGRELIQDYSIAVDTDTIPLGWYVWIDSEGHWFRADDTGGAVDGRHVDIYRGSGSRTVVADHSRIFTTATPHDYSDPSPYGGGGGGSAGGDNGGTGAGGSTPSGPNACSFAFDDECDEPNGTNVCPAGTDTYDCTWFPPGGTSTTGTNTCTWAYDLACDHSNGTGACANGTDTWDCTYYPPGGSSSGTSPTGPNTCTWAYDRVCDEPNGTNVCATGTDQWDCTYYPPSSSGSTGSTGSTGTSSSSNSCYWAFDRVCDEPNGTNVCSTGTDTWDCTWYPPSSSSTSNTSGSCWYNGERLDFYGTCDGSYWVVWCDEAGEIQERYCGSGTICGWRDWTVGYDCVSESISI